MSLRHAGGGAGDAVAEGGAVVALERPYLVGQSLQDAGVEGPVLPVLDGVSVYLAVLVGDVQEAAGGLAVGLEVLVGLIDDGFDPAGVPLDVVAGGSPLAADIADEHGVLFDEHRLIAGPCVEAAGALHLLALVLVFLVVLRVDLGPLGVENDVTVVMVSSDVPDMLDPRADRGFLIHVIFSFYDFIRS